MSHRDVYIINATAPAKEQVRGANLNEIRVEIRLILPPQVSYREVREVLNEATDNAADKAFEVRK